MFSREGFYQSRHDGFTWTTMQRKVTRLSVRLPSSTKWICPTILLSMSRSGLFGIGQCGFVLPSFWRIVSRHNWIHNLFQQTPKGMIWDTVRTPRMRSRSLNLFFIWWARYLENVRLQQGYKYMVLFVIILTEKMLTMLGGSINAEWFWYEPTKVIVMEGILSKYTACMHTSMHVNT